MAKHRVACLLLLERKGNADQSALFKSLAEACGRFTPQIAIRPGEAIFLEIGASRKLFSEKMLEMKLISLARRFGWRSCVGYADDAGTALANARFHHPRLLPLHALHDYASPFAERGEKNVELFRRVDELIQTLRRLGLESVRDFVALPPGSLASRFGKEAVELAAGARGELGLAWPSFQPAERILERTVVENSESVEALVFTLKWLVDRATARLCGRGERVTILEVELELAKWSTLKFRKRRFKFHLPLPQGSASALIPIIQERLRYELAKEPLTAPVDAITFEVLETVPAAGAQKDFFNRKEEEAEVWGALVARMAMKLGKGRVFVAEPVERHLPEKAFGRTLTLAGRSSPVAIVPRRPSRLLRQPEPLQRTGTTLVHPSSGKRWNVLRWEGPERVSGEWWSNAFHRDYYRVVTDQGELLWVYLSPGQRASVGRASAPVDTARVIACRDTGGITSADHEGGPNSGEPWVNGNLAMAPRRTEPPSELFLHGYFD